MGAFDWRPQTKGADDFARAPNIGEMSVGKQTLTSSMPHANHTPGTASIGKQSLTGPAQVGTGADLSGEANLAPGCEDKDATTPGCFLRENRRSVLITRIGARIAAAQTNYKLALQRLRFEELLKKEEDLHWAISLAMDVAGGHVLSMALEALKGARKAGVSALADAELQSLLAGQESGWVGTAADALAAVSDKHIENVSTAGFDVLKRGTTSELKEDLNRGNETKKQSSLSFISILLNSCDVGFDRFLSNVIAGTDADKVIVFHAMSPTRHQEEKYYQELKIKLERFHKSRVMEIGKSVTADERSNNLPVDRDTRVVYVRNVKGLKTPWFQSQTGDMSGHHLGYEKKTFGPYFPLENARLIQPVPDEFRDIAIARSEMLWGPTPTIDDGYTTYMKQLGYDVDKLQKHTDPAQARGSLFSGAKVPWQDPSKQSSSEPQAAPAKKPYALAPPPHPLAPFNGFEGKP